MAESSKIPITKRCAIVTGANKGIGFEICKQLAEKGVMVVMTARDEKRGVEALQKLTALNPLLSDHVVFHQLDVADPASVASLVDFIKTRFGKLDILINNAGVSGITIECDPLVLKWFLEDLVSRAVADGDYKETKYEGDGRVIETYELGEECVQINYYGAKRMTEAFIPLLQISDLPRIVNVSSTMGMLKFVSNPWAISELSEVNSLSEERIDKVLNEFLKDFKEGSLQTKEWPCVSSAYKISKAALNAYTRIIAKKYPNLCINSICPGYVRTDITLNTGPFSVEEGAECPVKLALLPDGGPSGLFFQRDTIASF